nr:hypothetical protein [Tanacetum cinerariifolium]
MPTKDKEKALWVELKRLYEPNAADVFWKLQRYMHDPLTWKLYTNCGVHQVSSTRRHDIFMFPEKDYHLTYDVLLLMLSTKLQVDEDCEMARDLMMKIFMEANKPKSRKSLDTSSKLNDAEGTACLPNAAIFEELVRMGVLSLEQTKTNQAAKIKKLKRLVKKLEGMKKKRTHRLKRLYKVGLSARIVSSEEEGLGRMNEEDLFGVHDLSGDEVFVDVTTCENIEQDATIAEKEISTADPVTTAGEVVTTAEGVEVAATATIPQISNDELSLAQTLMEIKAAKPKAKRVKIQEPNQISLDEEVARKLEAKIKAKMEKEGRIAREKEEANIAMIAEWDNTQAMIDADCELAAKL